MWTSRRAVLNTHGLLRSVDGLELIGFRVCSFRIRSSGLNFVLSRFMVYGLGSRNCPHFNVEIPLSGVLPRSKIRYKEGGAMHPDLHVFLGCGLKPLMNSRYSI